MNDNMPGIINTDQCELGEGPTYDPQTDTAWWFDILGSKLYEHRFGSGGPTIVHDLPMMASVLAFAGPGRQLLATETGLFVRDTATGSLDLHTPLEADNPITRSNDGRVHPSGALWIGTMGKNAEAKAGAIYWFRGGELRTLYPDVSIPNAICFSADGATAYFTDTMKGLLFRVDCDPATGLPTGEPSIFVDHRGKDGGLDGAVMDADGVIWNARWGAGAVDAYAPDGTRIRTIDMPVRQPSCPCFVGKDGAKLLVTSAWEGMDEAARAADPKAGNTFLLDLGLNGRFDPPVLL